MNNKKIICSVLLAGSLLTGCTVATPTGQSQNSGKGTGTIGGAALGALLGQVIGQDTKGTLIGAGVGALAGLGWGAYKDQQAKALQESLAGTDVSITDGGDHINLNLPGGVTFPTDGYYIQSSFYGPLNEIANVLVQYPETRIEVSGNTDDTGSYSYNQQLSLKRAESVANFLVSRGVSRGRVNVFGFGSDNPIASNATVAGRAANRRVEIQIFPAY